jgi:CYTH domain-containing protein
MIRQAYNISHIKKTMIERELTFLAKHLPEGLIKCESKEIIDIYLPKESDHPTLRIRKNGNKYEITKKEPISENDVSVQTEQTIPLTEKEFETLSNVSGKKIRKLRYLYDHKGKTAEIDIFQDDLKGLVVVDFEFENHEEKDAFEIPDFCLVDVTQEKFIAGGMVCGKCYEDLIEELEKFDYKKILI